jgi:uncharacterized protein involved in oxidation of intracellular sulfur|tara:strand:+ start:252 stop:575 length:324 start_codon:yes stop_codon:yes gene_type:complete
MKIGIVLNSNDPETAWSACRFGLTAIGENHEVTMFLLGPGVEIESIVHKRFDAPKALKKYLDNGGNILTCGTCLAVRKMEEGVNCQINKMTDLVNLVAESDKTITFG